MVDLGQERVRLGDISSLLRLDKVRPWRNGLGE